MRSFTIVNLFINLLLLASVAWSFPDIFEAFGKRADTTTASDSTTSSGTTTTSSATDSTTTTGSGTTTTAAATTGTGSSSTGTNTNTNTNTATTGTTGTTASGSKTTSFTSSSSVSVDAEDPAGGASMTYPASTSTTYYKIGNNVTMGWNYTSVEITPTGVDVIASCSSNSATYTLAHNVSYANATQVIWNTDNYGSDSEYPLLTADYTLIIYEAGTNPTDVASAGQLGPASHTFGMYIRQSYTPLNEYVCVTCSAAVSDMERQAFGFMLAMAAITVTTFTIFAGGIGLLL